MKSELISIIVPIYNVEDYLYECLNSIENQSFKNIEVLMIDDGSQDKSGQICDEFCSKDGRFHVVHQNNNGLSESRNVGKRLSHGDYITFIDGDDVIHPQMIEVLYESIIEGNFLMAVCQCKKVNGIPKKYDAIAHGNIEKEEMSQDELMMGLYGKSENNFQYQIVCNKMYKRSLLNDMDFLRVRLSEDTEFNNRAFLKIEKSIFIKHELYFWVQRSTSITHQAVNANDVTLIDTYCKCLDAIPDDKMGYKSYCLGKLYKVILSVRYRCYGTPFRTLAKKETRTVVKNTLSQFLSNHKIPFMIKSTLLIMLFVPIIYSVYISVCEHIYKRHK